MMQRPASNGSLHFASLQLRRQPKDMTRRGRAMWQRVLATAANACASHGMRLCSAEELTRATCGGSVCSNLDKRYIWSDTSCEK